MMEIIEVTGMINKDIQKLQQRDSRVNREQPERKEDEDLGNLGEKELRRV